MVFNATFDIISVISRRSVLLVEETGENHQPAASHETKINCIGLLRNLFDSVCNVTLTETVFHRITCRQIKTHITDKIKTKGK
jgi:hypothetical protein